MTPLPAGRYLKSACVPYQMHSPASTRARRSDPGGAVAVMTNPVECPTNDQGMTNDQMTNPEGLPFELLFGIGHSDFVIPWSLVGHWWCIRHFLVIPSMAYSRRPSRPASG